MLRTYCLIALLLLTGAGLSAVVRQAATAVEIPLARSPSGCADPFEAAVLVHYREYFFGPRDDPAELALADCTPGVLVPVSVERLLRDRYLAPTAAAGARRPPALTVEALARRTGFRDWPVELVTDGLAKRLPRRIYRSPLRALRMSVAQTLLPDGRVRETEVAIARARAPGAADFYAYGADGRLASSADFGTVAQPVHLPAPEICLRCHFDSLTRTFSLRPPFAAPLQLAQARAR